MRNRDYLDLEEERLKLEREEQKKLVLNCDKCGANVYDKEEYYFYERDCLCEECFDEIQKDEKFEARRIAGEDDEF